ncbi:hypothetical protein DSECCO2_655610 [anaerobic digester metagenome]
MRVDRDRRDPGQGEVERDRVRKERDDQSAEGRVHMEEEVVLHRQIGKVPDRVDHAVLGRPDDTDDPHRLVVDQPLNTLEVDPEFVVERGRPDGDAEHAARLLEREVRRSGDHHVRPVDRPAGLGDPKGLDVGLGAARGRVPSRPGVVVEVAKGGDQLPLDGGRSGKEPRVTKVRLDVEVVCPDRDGVRQGAHRGEDGAVGEVFRLSCLERGEDLVLGEAALTHASAAPPRGGYGVRFWRPRSGSWRPRRCSQRSS